MHRRWWARSLVADPEHVPAHAFGVASLLMACDSRNRPLVTERLETLNRLAPRANDRERSHIAALNAWASGDWYSHRIAMAMCWRPTPATPLPCSPSISSISAAAIPASCATASPACFPYWDASVPGHSFVAGLYGFALEEDGYYTPRRRARYLCLGERQPRRLARRS